MNTVLSEIKDIIEKGYISRPYIGVTVDTVREEVQKYGIPAGAEVLTVTKDTPAYKAGLQVGDIVTHINDKAIKTSQNLVDMVQASEIGETLILTVFRKGDTIKISVTTGEAVQQTSPTEPEQLRPSDEENQGSVFPWPWEGIFGGM
jgi:serine protease Do